MAPQLGERLRVACNMAAVGAATDGQTARQKAHVGLPPGSCCGFSGNDFKWLLLVCSTRIDKWLNLCMPHAALMAHPFNQPQPQPNLLPPKLVVCPKINENDYNLQALWPANELCILAHVLTNVSHRTRLRPPGRATVTVPAQASAPATPRQCFIIKFCLPAAAIAQSDPAYL